jgi:hypothetical protein
MSLFKKMLSSSLALFLIILKSERRVNSVITDSKNLQNKVDDYLRRAQMNGENKWFLRSELEKHQKGL